MSRMTKALTGIAIMGLLLAALHFLAPIEPNEYCLDLGGSWNYELKKCEGARPGYKGP
jgi:hypothetical protein